MKKLLLLAFMCCFSLTARATHLLGGEILVKNTSGLTYEISSVLYLDLVNGMAAADAQTEIILCLGDGTQVVAKRISSEQLGGNPNVNRSVYRAVHTYGAAGNYTLTARLDNLANGMLNILPPSQELALVVQTTLNTSQSNTTALATTPKFFSGLRQVFTLDLPTTDPDDDSLSHRLVKLLAQPQECQPTLPANYIFPNEVTREGTFKIDFPAGKLIWNAPTRLGFYTYAYVTEEWRQGVKVAETWRTYSLTITDQNSSSDLVPPYEPVLVDFSGVITSLPPQEFMATNISMKLYPVPSELTVTVEVSTRQPSSLLIEMIDLQGRVLQKAEHKDIVSRKTQEFDTGTLPKGIYLIRVKSEQGTLTQKFVR